MKHLILFLWILTVFFITTELNAQKSHKALFLGNSYTGMNNLPQMVADVALSAGDTLIFDSSTPGGYRLLDHGTNILSQSKIQAGGWDYVVLQEQSRTPILWNNQFVSGGRGLNREIIKYSPCSETILYMTWGRKNGDASNCLTTPVMCTYEGMDSTLRNEYLDLVADIYAEVSPVSVVWNHLRQNNPGIDLYQPDASHPSLAGTYAAACCFYTTLFKKDPTLITFNGGLSAGDAASIRNAAKVKVFNDLNTWDYKQQTPPEANIKYNVISGVSGMSEVSFFCADEAESYFWDFGDNTTSTLRFVTHTYLSDGTYTVTLKTSNCSLSGLDTSLVSDTIIQFCSHTPTVNLPNPYCQHDTVWTQVADAYQWFDNNQPIPETNQYVANSGQYSFNFRVATTIGGCTEMSSPNTSSSSQPSGYYFDTYHYGNDPCVGDTVQFSVLHWNGLSGAEVIQWYRNGVLLPLFMNEDTLFITSGGIYECKVIAPNSSCPIDTTFASAEFDCGTVVNVEPIKQDQDLFCSIYPNPASESLTIKFTNEIISERLQIYNIMGHLIKEVNGSTTTTLNIEDLPSGIYFIRLKNKEHPALKFSKQ